MATNRSSVRLALAGVVLASLVGANISSAQTSRDHVVQMTARVVKKPLSITLQWEPSNATSISIYRRVMGQTAWSSPMTVSATATSYSDANIVVGTPYEYRIVRQSLIGGSTITSYGFIASGIEVPLRESRGRVLLVVDNTMSAPLAAELARLERDLAGDGWLVVRRDVDRDASPVSVKATIRDAYNEDPSATKSLFLFGHVPVPYSGNIAPDGHPDHRGAWPADVYYADMTANWTDTAHFETSQGRNRNERGDGRFDISYLADELELEVGRVDLWGMSHFPQSEAELLRRYLDKDHAYRQGAMVYTSRGLVDDNFGIVNGEAFAGSAWRNFSGFVGAENVADADWLTTLRGETYLFGYGCGGGTYESASGVASTADLVGMEKGAVFSMLFGSYFGDWDVPNSFLRAPLATGNGLTNAWVGRPAWYLHPMAIGETIGAGARLTQNNAGEYPTRHGRSVHISLMGDPTLRLNPLRPPTNVVVTVAKTGEALVTWTASPEPGVTYNVYRADRPGAEFVKLNKTPLTTASFQARRSSLARTATYMVRAVGLTTTPSGSYFNASQGAYGEVSGSVLITTVDPTSTSNGRAIKEPTLE